MDDYCRKNNKATLDNPFIIIIMPAAHNAIAFSPLLDFFYLAARLRE